ncbi:hypothetical protein N44_02686 [Microcystis aeruginosa NIES-44]|uniref:Uncharacterized protein n=1 Tax=Microcystis aeruginosa NIES-44 TaxID=449439 RepID=A0A0A1VXV0_MICAE|nr:hypothetical protein N44_02686 [Microcystis aeruginosa NIES-44]
MIADLAAPCSLIQANDYKLKTSMHSDRWECDWLVSVLRLKQILPKFWVKAPSF